MAFPRSLILAVTVAAGITASVSGSALAAPGAARTGPEQVNVAHTAAERALEAFAAREAARLRAHPVTANAPRALAGTVPGDTAFGNVQSIASDTLPTPPPPFGANIEPNTEVEPDVAIDPNNPRIITAVVQSGRDAPFGGAEAIGYATSHDGGRTWTDGYLPDLTTQVGGTFPTASDPVVAFGPDGSVYVETIAQPESGSLSAVTVQRSTDGGLTFGAPTFPTETNDPTIFNDKPWMAVDNSPASPHYGRIYAVWSKFVFGSSTTTSAGAVSYSDDQGRTWSPIQLATPTTDVDQGFLPLIHKDGSVTLVYDHTSGSNDFETAQTSHDGGQTWSTPVTIGQFHGATVPGVRDGGVPAAAIDPVTGDMYAVWDDNTFNSAGLNDIAFSASTDGGATWSTPRAADPAVAGADRFTPAVAAYNGDVYVTYRTRGANGTAPTVSQDYVASLDGGNTFGPDSQVGPASPITGAAVSDESPPAVTFFGDYSGLAATAHEVELAWCVSATPGANEQYNQTLWAGSVAPVVP